MTKKVRVTYVKSAIGYNKKQRGTIEALGFRKLYQSVVHEDSPALRGMLTKVSHLIEIEEEE